MAHEDALWEIEQLHELLASVARDIAHDWRGGQVTPLQGFQMGQHGMALAVHLLTMFQDMDHDTRDDVLYVLAHGRWMLEEEA